MPRTETEELERVHIWIYKRDVERLRKVFGKSLGFSRGTRAIIRQFLNNLENRASTMHTSTITKLTAVTASEEDEEDLASV